METVCATVFVVMVQIGSAGPLRDLPLRRLAAPWRVPDAIAADELTFNGQSTLVVACIDSPTGLVGYLPLQDSLLRYFYIIILL